MYPEEMVLPMRAELTQVGFQELYTTEEVENAIKESPQWYPAMQHNRKVKSKLSQVVNFRNWGK